MKGAEKLRRKAAIESCGKRGCSGCVELDVDAQDALDKDVDVDDVGVELVHVVELDVDVEDALDQDVVEIDVDVEDDSDRDVDVDDVDVELVHVEPIHVVEFEMRMRLTGMLT